MNLKVLTQMLIFFLKDPYYEIIIIFLGVICLIQIIWIIMLLLGKKRLKKILNDYKEDYKEVYEEEQFIQRVNDEEEIKVEDEILPSNNFENEEESNVALANIQTRYNYSFISRMHLAPHESQERFSKLKNFLLKYEGMKIRKTWRYEIFTLKKEIIAKVWIYNNVIDVYNNLDESLLEGIDFEKKEGKLMHEKTPMLCKISNNLNLRKLTAAFERKLSENKIIDNFIEEDYKVEYISKEKLLEMGLIKIKTGTIK